MVARQRFDELIDTYEQECREGRIPSVVNYLKERQAPADHLLLHELVRLELEYRLRAGEKTSVEECLSQHPTLTGCSDTVVDLVAHEFRVRQDCTGRVPVAEFLDRFPALRERLLVVLPALRRGPGEVPGYDLVAELGKGGMGIVYRARDRRLGREVAVKMMLPQYAGDKAAKERFLREARAASQLQHDHVVPIYQVGEADGLPFMVMPLLQGESLETYLKRGQAGKPMPVVEALRIAREIAEGLRNAHAAGLVHRDIKPANLWLEGERRRVKILDFGLASAGRGEARLTASRFGVGSPGYMAPEQARGEPADPRADLFSLGCVLYRLLAGKAPFQGPDAFSVLTSLAADTPVSPRVLNPDCPRLLAEFTMTLLAKDPALRPANADAVVRMLAHWEKQLVNSPRESLLAERPPNELVPSDLAPTEPAIVSPVSTDVCFAVHRPRRRVALLAAACLLLGPLLYLFGGSILRFVTNEGVLLVEIADGADVEITIENNGLKLKEKTKERSFTLTAGKGKIHVEEKDGISLKTAEPFELKRGGTTIVKVMLTKLPPGDADRTAAEYVLAKQGTVWVDGAFDRAIKDPDGLPKRPFTLSSFRFPDPNFVTDECLKPFAGCSGITQLDLSDSEASDRGFAFFRNCTMLTHLDLSGTSITGKALAAFGSYSHLRSLELRQTKLTNNDMACFANCAKLDHLDLADTQISDMGLKNFKGCTSLTQLLLAKSKVTNEGLAFFQRCTRLNSLYLDDTSVGDQGVALCANFPHLSAVHLDGTSITDQSLSTLKNCPSLERLRLAGTSVGDTGLGHLMQCKQLRELSLVKTKVTAAKVAAFRKALPNCKVSWDGDSASDPDRTAAMHVLAKGGKVWLNGEVVREVKAAAELPKEPFTLSSFKFPEPTKVTDEWLKQFAGCKKLTHLDLANSEASDPGFEFFRSCTMLTYLDLSGTDVTGKGLTTLGKYSQLRSLGLRQLKVTDDDMACFKDCFELDHLDLAETLVGDEGLACFKNCPKLSHLLLAKSKVTNAGLAHFKDCKRLRSLYLDDTAVGNQGIALFAGLVDLSAVFLDRTAITDEGLVALKDCTALEKLQLSGTAIGDKGLGHLMNCRSLKVLDLSKTKVTAAAVKKFRDALKGCIVYWDGDPADPDRAAALHVLKLGGSVVVNGDFFREIKTLPELPQKPFRLSYFQFLEKDRRNLTDDMLRPFEDCAHLTQIALTGSKVTDRGFAYFKRCTKLTHLDVSGTAVTSAGMACIKDYSRLKSLRLGGCKVNDADLHVFADSKRLTSLDLRETEVGDEGLAAFADCKELTSLFLGGCKRVRDAGIA